MYKYVKILVKQVMRKVYMCIYACIDVMQYITTRITIIDKYVKFHDPYTTICSKYISQSLCKVYMSV